MKGTLDETDAEILRLLVEDGRIAYSEVADEVGMSAPAVIDRVERLREDGVIEGFEARLDRSLLGGTRLLVRFSVSPDETHVVAERVADDERSETVFVSADGTVTVVANARPDEAADIVDGLEVRDFEVSTVVSEAHDPGVRQPSFAPDCVECGNTVDDEGVSAQVAGDLYHFCCESCESAFEERYGSMG